MSRKCKISGVSRQSGHRVSHANNKTKHVFKANLQSRRVYIPEEKKFVRIKVSTRIIRTIDKLGITETLRKYNLSVKDLAA
jgi:large subunit ribosomal protein L28